MIHVIASGYGMGTSVPVKTGVSLSLVAATIRLQHANSTAAGTVVDEAGNPVANFRIIAANLKGVETTSDSNGHFVLKNVPSGTTAVCVGTGAYANGQQTVTSGRSDNIIRFIPYAGAP